MASTDTRENIANRASLLLGGAPITSLDSGENLESETASAFIGQATRGLLTDYEWPFAGKRLELTRLPDAPLGLDTFLYEYSLPPDLLKARYLVSRYSYDIISQKLRTSDANPVLEYTYEPSPAEYPPGFVEALVWKLAALMAVALSEDPNKAVPYERKADSIARKNVIDELQSRTAQEVESNYFIDVRRGIG